MNDYMRHREAADLLGLTVRQLDRLCGAGQGPPRCRSQGDRGIKLYRRTDVERYVGERDRMERERLSRASEGVRRYREEAERTRDRVRGRIAAVVVDRMLEGARRSAP